MFEPAKPILPAQDARFLEKSKADDARDDGSNAKVNIGAKAEASPNDLLIGSPEPSPETAASDGGALRTLEWSELKARLSAARDLRLLLRRDATGQITGETGSFADAAAQYFGTRSTADHTIEDEYKPGVNPVALEQLKGSPGMMQTHSQTYQGLQQDEAPETGNAAIGDSRDY